MALWSTTKAFNRMTVLGRIAPTGWIHRVALNEHLQGHLPRLAQKPRTPAVLRFPYARVQRTTGARYKRPGRRQQQTPQPRGFGPGLRMGSAARAPAPQSVGLGQGHGLTVQPHEPAQRLPAQVGTGVVVAGIVFRAHITGTKCVDLTRIFFFPPLAAHLLE